MPKQIHHETLPELFHSLSEEQAQMIMSKGFVVNFKSNETIFKQSGALTHIIYIIEGKAKVLLEDSANQTLLLRILKPNEIIGGPGFLTDYRHYFSIVAIEDTWARFIDINLFKDIVLSNPQFLIDLIAFLNRGFIELYEKLKSLTNKHMNGRLADTLLYLSDIVYNSYHFTTSLSRLDIANMASMTKESAIRTLKEFKADGIIECEGNTFKILKREVLLDISKKG